MVYPHKLSPISCRSSAGQLKFAGQRLTFYHCATQLFTYCCLVFLIICITLVLRLGHATGGARVLIWTCWGLRQRLVATWAEFQHSVVYYATERCWNDWKHVLTQKLVTLNTCCDIACLIFQLPCITNGSFQSHRRQPTTGSLQSGKEVLRFTS